MPTLLATGDASANHAWGNYHWAVQTDTFTLKLGDNLTTAEWDLYHAAVSGDWSVAYDLDTTIVAGTGCSNSPTRGLGRTEVCNKKYGATGWLGLAQIWVYSDGHIAKAHAKMNDTYFNTSTYNTPSWKQMVLCQ
ncbi:MAG: hypothetical protein HY678_00220, partial [Chloroflexi bacterium]|nr:hypothetical protein [Chloroflexota bacterium]